ncbi:MAG: methyltransferase domain-containing protein [Caulobacteraceae bacterium]
MDAPPRLFDRELRRRRLDRAARSGADAHFLRRRVAEDFVGRIAVSERAFPLALDLAAGSGAFAQALAGSPARERIGLLVQSDFSIEAIRRAAGPRLVADEERLPLGEARLDLIVCGLSLHWANDLIGSLVQIRRALHPGGLMLAALFCGETLFELRRSLIEAEAELRGGAGPRVSPLLHPSDAPSLLQRAGFHSSVVDLDKTRVRYPALVPLLSDLRAMAETSVLFERPRAPLSRKVLAAAERIYGERHADQDGRIEATFEIAVLTGWAP